MRWQNQRRSDNVDDRRGRKGGRALKVGGAGGVLLVVGIIVVGAATGTDVSQILALVAGDGGGAPTGATSPEDDAQADFVSVVLADTEDTWTPLFSAQGQRYAAPRLVLFRDRVNSACGMQSSATGPFYCPGDRQVYIDLAFFEELDRRFGAPGDFAQAYVLAHEVGHHVQTLTGVSARMRQQGRGQSEAARNELSVRQELQADCYAGVWGHHANRRDLLDPEDLSEGLRAAAAIGDDALQEGAGRVARPESFTHGTSAQRMRWFRVGFDTGDMNRCDTYSGSL